MKITYVMLEEGFGGIERTFMDWTQIMSSRGHTVQVIIHQKFSKKAELLNFTNLEIVELPSFRGKHDLLCAWRIKKAIKRFKPELVQSYVLRCSYMVGKITRKLKVPHVTRIDLYYKAKAYHTTDRFIVLNESQAKQVDESGRPNDYSIIPNVSLLPARETPHLRKHQNEKLIFSCLGRLSKEKNIDVLINAAAFLKKEGVKFKILIGGDGVEREPLKELSQKLNVEKEVEFCGWVDDTQEFLKKGDFFINCSDHEAFPLTILEAMSIGQPVVTTKTAGAEMIFEDDQALKVQVGDAKSLADGMITLIINEALRHKLASASLQKYREKYTVDAVYPQVKKFYLSSLEHY